MTPVRIREIDSALAAEALDLVRQVFREHVAPLYSPEGVAQLESYTAAEAQAKRLESGHSLFVAETDQDGMLGVAELRADRHLSMFFVRTAHQRQGIGRELLSAVAARCRSAGAAHLTVHASPNSVGAYRRLGFVPQGPEQEKNGVRFVPMVLVVGEAGGA